MMQKILTPPWQRRISIAISALVLGAFLLRLTAAGQHVVEDVMFTLSPTPERAFAYGERHFDAQDPSLYDIDRASYFFEKAAFLNGNIPYLEHERARVAFLRGDFSQALSLINVQIGVYGTTTPNSYYIRGLIEGYMGKYADAIVDYRKFLTFDPEDWAAMNDYAWVLLKAERYQDAVDVTMRGLSLFPQNPWLLSSNSIALYELGDVKDALSQAKAAQKVSATLAVRDWLRAYPGNDPRVAQEGVATLQKSIADNIHTIERKAASSTIQ